MSVEYHESMQITRSFTFCPNAFRIDMYRGCDFGCKYCFANMEMFNEQEETKWREARFEKIERRFKTALETDTESKDILVELLRHRVPLHCGGMSDPFQSREWELGLTKRLIELSNKYHYPICFSTKTAYLPEEYFEILNPEIHAFQVSIMGWDDDYVRKWESNTPTAKERFDFVQQLRGRGFWTAIRIQPVINIQQVMKLCYNIKNKCDYVTVEHFKMIYDTTEGLKAFWELCDNKQDFILFAGRLETRRDVKIRNIEIIKRILNGKVKVGVGDNDLHYLSDTRCCCGIDTINKNFDNYLKYNLTYMATGDLEKDTFIPKCNPRKHINDQKYGLVIDCKQYVEDYIHLHPDYIGPRRQDVEKELFGISQRRIF